VVRVPVCRTGSRGFKSHLRRLDVERVVTANPYQSPPELGDLGGDAGCLVLIHSLLNPAMTSQSSLVDD
jgi:hypothetical protein